MKYKIKEVVNDRWAVWYKDFEKEMGIKLEYIKL